MEKIKVLYAEDNSLTAALNQRILEEEGFETVIAANGSQAWKIYREWHPDILLLDLDMPGKDGLEVTRLVREQTRSPYIIIHTSYSDPTKEVAALDAGADEFITKDKPSEVLRAHLKRIRQKICSHMNIPQLYRLSGHTSYNSTSRELTINGVTKKLTEIDGRLLQLLCAKSNEVASKAYLITGMWGPCNLKKDDALKKYVSRVRKYLEKDSSLLIRYRDEGYILMSVSA